MKVRCLVFLILLVCIYEANGRGRGGGGGRGGGSRGGGGYSGGGWSNPSSGGSRSSSSGRSRSTVGKIKDSIFGSRGSSSSSSGTKSKGFGKIKGGTLKKAAVIGIGAYGAYKIGKLAGKYSSWNWGRQNGFDINDWDDWREVDGLLCRTTSDCSWIDPRLYCQDYELRFTPSVSPFYFVRLFCL